MRITLWLLFFSLWMTSFLIPAKGYASDTVAISLCRAIVADDRQKFRAILNTHNIRIRQVFLHVRCNDLSMLQFAITAEALDVGELLIRQLPGKTLELERFQGKTIVEWAVHSGYASSPVLGLIREKVGN